MEGEKGIAVSPSWEKRVYNRYVTTGGLPSHADPSVLFGPGAGYLKRMLRDHVLTSVPKTASIIELACGPAPLVYFLKQQGYANLVGIDTSPEQVKLAHGIGLEKEVIQGDLLTFLETAQRNSIDVIFMFDILEHFTVADQFDLIDKVFDVLKLNGRLLLHVPNAAGIFGSRVLYSDITHKTAFTRRSLEQLLLTVGFREIKCYEDKPIGHGVTGTIRRILWEIITIGQVVVLAAETGNYHRSAHILSMNMLAVAKK